MILSDNPFNSPVLDVPAPSIEQVYQAIRQTYYRANVQLLHWHSWRPEAYLSGDVVRTFPIASLLSNTRTALQEGVRTSCVPHANMSSPNLSKQLRIAVLLTFEAQMLDLAGIDLFGMVSKDYLATSLPQPIVAQGLDVKIWYVGKAATNRSSNAATPEQNSASEGSLVNLTAQAQIKTNATVQDRTVQPGSVDILMIPGPDPATVHDQETLKFVRGHAEHGTTILTVCTGCFVAAEAGILNERSASGPRALVPGLRKTYPAVKWDDQKRFVKDAAIRKNGTSHELWTSGGITNGLEMVAAYLKEKYPGPLSETVCAMADVGEKGEFYETKVGVDNAWWLGQILRALFQGKRR